MEVFLVLPAVVVGAISQRVTGMGFALVVAPFLLLLLDPLSAVIIVNLCGAAAAVVIGMRTHRNIDWRRFAWLAPCALLGIVPGTYLLLVVPRSILEISIGALLLLALALTLMAKRLSTRVIDGSIPMMLSGLASGLMNSAAGVGGPAATIYAVMSGWKQQSFAATMQPYLFTIASASLISKAVMAPTSWPEFDPWVWLAIPLALILGLVLGERLSRKVSAQVARSLVIGIAGCGAFVAILKGLTGLS